MSYYSNDDSYSDVSNESSFINERIVISKEKVSTIAIDIKLYNNLLSKLNSFINWTKVLKNKESCRPIMISEPTQSDPITILSKSEEQWYQQNKEWKLENDILKGEVNAWRVDNSQWMNDYASLKWKDKNQIEKWNWKIKELEETNGILEKKYLAWYNKTCRLKEVTATHEGWNCMKVVDKIISYLPEEYYLTIGSLNRQWHTHYYYKMKYEYITNKYTKLEKTWKGITNKDISKLFNVMEKDIQVLLEKYTNSHLIPGNNLRYRIIHSLLFIENVIREPLRKMHMKQELNGGYTNSKGTPENESSFTNKTKGFFSSIINTITNDDNNYDNIYDIPNFNVTKSQITELTSPVVSLPNEFIDDLSSHDKRLLQVYNKISWINVKFEFDTPEQISTLLNYFFQANLEKDSYVRFFQHITYEFSQLLFNAFNTIKQIKEIEIVNQALYVRYIRYKYLCEDMQDELADWNNFAESSKQIKEKLVKQKNDVEVKYNEWLMSSAKIWNENETGKKEIQRMEKEMWKMKNDYIEYKEKIANEYENIRNDFSVIAKERNLLRDVLVDFKRYFMNTISDCGEMI